jgi:hypothetical protein
MKVVRLSALTPQEILLLLMSLEAESTTGSQCGRKDCVNEKFQWHHRDSNPRTSGLKRIALSNCATVCPRVSSSLLLFNDTVGSKCVVFGLFQDAISYEVRAST